MCHPILCFLFVTVNSMNALNRTGQDTRSLITLTSRLDTDWRYLDNFDKNVVEREREREREREKEKEIKRKRKRENEGERIRMIVRVRVRSSRIMGVYASIMYHRNGPLSSSHGAQQSWLVCVCTHLTIIVTEYNSNVYTYHTQTSTLVQNLWPSYDCCDLSPAWQWDTLFYRHQH